MKSLLSIPAFASLYLVLAHYWHVPRFAAYVYGLMSLLCFVAYAWDKFAARTRRRRTRESTLLMWGLFCGWPGAVLAQQLLRHKSSKVSFGRSFWLTVALNVAGFLAWIVGF